MRDPRDEIRELRGQLDETNRAMWSLYKELDDRNAELDQFALIASHDLQEPLRRAMALNEELAAGYAASLDADGRAHLDEMRRVLASMLRLIEDLLRYARVTSQAQPFEIVSLDAIADEVVADLNPRLRDSHGAIELGSLPTVEGDPMQLRQLLQNLIGNALKFHAPDRPPVVRVTAEPADDGECRISVADNGIGFDRRHASRALQPFRRLHGRDRYEGTGMGLAICEKIARRHHGRIAIDSAVGKGTTVSITLPERQPAPTASDTA